MGHEVALKVEQHLHAAIAKGAVSEGKLYETRRFLRLVQGSVLKVEDAYELGEPACIVGHLIEAIGIRRKISVLVGDSALAMEVLLSSSAMSYKIATMLPTRGPADRNALSKELGKAMRYNDLPRNLQGCSDEMGEEHKYKACRIIVEAIEKYVVSDAVHESSAAAKEV